MINPFSSTSHLFFTPSNTTAPINSRQEIFSVASLSRDTQHGLQEKLNALSKDSAMQAKIAIVLNTDFFGASGPVTRDQLKTLNKTILEQTFPADMAKEISAHVAAALADSFSPVSEHTDLAAYCKAFIECFKKNSGEAFVKEFGSGLMAVVTTPPNFEEAATEALSFVNEWVGCADNKDSSKFLAVLALQQKLLEALSTHVPGMAPQRRDSVLSIANRSSLPCRASMATEIAVELNKKLASGNSAQIAEVRDFFMACKKEDWVVMQSAIAMAESTPSIFAKFLEGLDAKSYIKILSLGPLGQRVGEVLKDTSTLNWEHLRTQLTVEILDEAASSANIKSLFRGSGPNDIVLSMYTAHERAAFAAPLLAQGDKIKRGDTFLTAVLAKDLPQEFRTMVTNIITEIQTTGTKRGEDNSHTQLKINALLSNMLGTRLISPLAMDASAKGGLGLTAGNASYVMKTLLGTLHDGEKGLPDNLTDAFVAEDEGLRNLAETPQRREQQQADIIARSKAQFQEFQQWCETQVGTPIHSRSELSSSSSPSSSSRSSARTPSPESSRPLPGHLTEWEDGLAPK